MSRDKENISTFNHSQHQQQQQQQNDYDKDADHALSSDVSVHNDDVTYKTRRKVAR